MRWPLALVPGISIVATAAATSAACGGLQASAAKVPGRPPGWVFSVVWPALYVTTGVAWASSDASTDFAFVALVVLLCAWLPVYSCAKRKGVAAAVLATSTVAALGLSVALFAGKKSVRGGAWLVPLCLWLGFATYLNVAEVFRPGGP
jgi:tryptophan-rich sensory protein